MRSHAEPARHRGARMCRKIEVAVDAAQDDTLIIARTDARTALGLDEAIRRGQEYAKTGADIVFVEAPESEDEFKRVGDEIDCWLLANMVPTGKSPVVSAEKLKSYGFCIAIYPSAGMAVVCAALEQSYGYLKAKGSTEGRRARLHDGAAARADRISRSLGVRAALRRSVITLSRPCRRPALTCRGAETPRLNAARVH